MKVENHTGRITKIPIMAQAEGGNVIEKSSIILLPGVNEVDPAAWAEAKKIALVKSLLEAGHRRGGFVEGDPKKSIASLESVSEKEAIELVEETVDLKLLDRWAKLEKREKVALAIAAQLEKIDPKKDRVNGFGDAQ